MGNKDDPAEVARAAVEAANVLKVDRKNRKLERLECGVRSKGCRKESATQQAAAGGGQSQEIACESDNWFLFSYNRNSEKPTGRLQFREKGNGGLRNRSGGRDSDNVEDPSREHKHCRFFCAGEP